MVGDTDQAVLGIRADCALVRALVASMVGYVLVVWVQAVTTADPCDRVGIEWERAFVDTGPVGLIGISIMQETRTLFHALLAI